ncbi:MAG: GNAT family N-acetyltransferase [Rhizobiales bacterium]|nr:GNAT family N-acetyltransferase [Hyphomicrobiales bacterium]
MQMSDGVIRKLWILDAPKYRDHLLRLDPVSRHNRFGGAVSDSYLRHHADVSIGPASVIHGFFADGILRGAAELRRIGARFAKEGEVAFSVESPYQSHGIGSALLERTLLAARNRGVRYLNMCCLADNRRMQQLARKFAADLTFEFGSVTGEVVTPVPTPMSMIREIVADSHGMAVAVFDAQSRMLKPA